MGSVLDQALQRAFPRGTPIRFLQIGGNDGVHQDPLYEHHVNGTFDFEWGEIFEPIPEYFDLLTENLRQFPYIRCHQLAVDDADEVGKRQFNYVSPADVEKHHLPPSSRGIGSFSRDRNALGGVGYGEAKYRAIRDHIRTIDVDTIPVTEVIKRYPDANLLVTDCEGHDVEIIHAAFKNADFRPPVVQFEHLGHNEELLRSTIKRLEALGYRISRAGKDVIAESVGISQTDCSLERERQT